MKKSKKRWRGYFVRLFNGSSTQDLLDLIIQCQNINRNYMPRISESEVKEALKRIKSRKIIGPDGIPIEVWRCLREMGVRWLTNLFNKIWLTKRCQMSGGIVPEYLSMRTKVISRVVQATVE